MKQFYGSLAAVLLAFRALIAAEAEVAPVAIMPAVGTAMAPPLERRIGVGLAAGNFSAALPGIAPVDKNVLSVRCDMEIIHGSWFIESRYEHIETELAELEYFRFFLNTRRPLFGSLSFFAGVGYGHQTNLIDISGDPLRFGGGEFLLDAGLSFGFDPFHGTLRYIHCLTRSLKSDFRSDVQRYSEGSFGFLEVRLDHSFSSGFGSSLSVETQLGNNTYIKENYMVAIGITYHF